MHIILADHHQQTLWALKTILLEDPKFELNGEAVDTQGLLSQAENNTTDLVPVDKDLPGL